MLSALLRYLEEGTPHINFMEGEIMLIFGWLILKNK
jgi:hypothetical protein